MKLEFPLFTKGHIMPQIGRTTKLMSHLVKALFAHHNIDLTKEQFILLLCLEDGPKPQSSLALITERDKGSLTRLVQSLEKKGYIKRQNCESDNRVNHVEIDEKGKKILDTTKPLMLKTFKSLQSGIEPEHREIAMQVLKQIQENLNTEFETIEQTKN